MLFLSDLFRFLHVYPHVKGTDTNEISVTLGILHWTFPLFPTCASLHEVLGIYTYTTRSTGDVKNVRV